MHSREALSLGEYVAALERENSAKVKEQEILYRQLQSLRVELVRMQECYAQNKCLRQQLQQASNTLQYQHNQIATLEQHNYDLICSNQQLEGRVKQYELLLGQAEQKCEAKQHQLVQAIRQQDGLRSSRDQVIVLLQQRQEEASSLREALEVDRAQMEHIEELAENYEKVELAVFQKESAILELHAYIAELEQQAQGLNEQLFKLQAYTRHLEQEAQNHRASSDRRQPLSELTSHISKMELIRQNNRAIQKIVELSSESQPTENCWQHRWEEWGSLQGKMQALKEQKQSLLRGLAL